MTVNSFMSWIGGKKSSRDIIIPRFPLYYERYIEVFGGGGWILFGKPPGNDSEVFNDANSNISNLFYCVREHSAELIEKLRFVLNCREDFDRIKHIISEKAEIGDVQRAANFYQLIRYSYASGCDSFGGKPHSSLEAVRELKTLGISVYFEKENIDTGEISSEMLLAIYSQFAQEESMSISRNCRLGIKKRMMDGTYNNASAPFGYDYVNGRLQINLKKAEVVRQIFSWYVSGIGMTEIAERLNQQKIRKEIWRKSTIRCILTNEKYIGDTLMQKSFTTDSLPFRCIKNRGEKEQYYVIGTHEPIIEKSIFDYVQKAFAERNKSNGLADNHSPFSKKIVCGNCGCTFRRKNRKSYMCWVCRKHDESADNCGIRQIRETELQRTFVRLWNKLQAYGKAILIPMLKQLETLSEQEKVNNTQLAELRKEISEIKQQAYLLTILNSQGTLDGAYFKERTQELDRKLITAQKQLHASLDDKYSERLENLRKLIRILDGAEPITDFNVIKFRQVVEKIVVLSEKEIQFDLIGGIGFTEQIER